MERHTVPLSADFSSMQSSTASMGVGKYTALWEANTTFDPSHTVTFAAGILIGGLAQHYLWRQRNFLRIWRHSRLPHELAGQCYPMTTQPLKARTRFLFLLFPRLFTVQEQWANFLEQCTVLWKGTSGGHRDKAGPLIRCTVDKVLRRQSFAIGFSSVLRQPLWASFFMTKDSLQLVRIQRNEMTEAEAASITVFSKDHEAEGCMPVGHLQSTGYDRGHLAPYASVGCSPHSVAQSFLLSNVVPQDRELNRGLWRRLEGFTRMWTRMAYNGAPVAIVVGPVFALGQSGGSSTMRYVNGMAVPDFLFLAIHRCDARKGVAFLVQNRPVPAAFRKSGGLDMYLNKSCMSVGELERRVRKISGEKDFCVFTNLPTQWSCIAIEDREAVDSALFPLVSSTREKYEPMPFPASCKSDF